MKNYFWKCFALLALVPFSAFAQTPASLTWEQVRQRFEQNKTLLRLAGFQRLAFSPGGCLSGLARNRPDSQLAFV